MRRPAAPWSEHNERRPPLRRDPGPPIQATGVVFWGPIGRGGSACWLAGHLCQAPHGLSSIHHSSFGINPLSKYNFGMWDIPRRLNLKTE